MPNNKDLLDAVEMAIENLNTGKDNAEAELARLRTAIEALAESYEDNSASHYAIVKTCRAEHVVYHSTRAGAGKTIAAELRAILKGE